MTNENKNQRTATDHRRPLTRYLIAFGIAIAPVLLYLLVMGFFTREGVAAFAVDSGLVIGRSGDVLMPETSAYAVLEGTATAEALLASAHVETVLNIARIRMLADAFFASGVLVFGIGGLVFASQEGVFDGLNYSIRQLWWFFQVRNRGDKHETFRDFKKRLSEKPKARFGHLMIAGLVMLLIAVVLIIRFMKF